MNKLFRVWQTLPLGFVLLAAAAAVIAQGFRFA
jgi:hypothetical protein